MGIWEFCNAKTVWVAPTDDDTAPAGISASE